MATITHNKTYSVTCTCGEKMEIEASSREEAAQRMRDSLDELALANHGAERHPGGDAPTVEEMGDIIELTLYEE